jgi:hypothetical protein
MLNLEELGISGNGILQGSAAQLPEKSERNLKVQCVH